MTQRKIFALCALLAAIFAVVFSFAGLLPNWIIPLVCLGLGLIAVAILLE